MLYMRCMRSSGDVCCATLAQQIVSTTVHATRCQGMRFLPELLFVQNMRIFPGKVGVFMAIINLDPVGLAVTCDTCQVCVSCDECVTAQDCTTCDTCDVAQKPRTCVSCYTCDSCNTC